MGTWEDRGRAESAEFGAKQPRALPVAFSTGGEATQGGQWVTGSFSYSEVIPGHPEMGHGGYPQRVGILASRHLPPCHWDP